MRNQEDGLADNLSLEYSLLSLQFDGLWLLDRHECWARDCDFETHMRMNRRLTILFVG